MDGNDAEPEHTVGPTLAATVLVFEDLTDAPKVCLTGMATVPLDNPDVTVAKLVEAANAAVT